MNTLLIICLILIIVLVIVLSIYFYYNLHHDRNLKNKIFSFGFNEKQIGLSNGTILHYGEGPQNGEPLLLIHGQGVDWKSYAKVLPELSKHFHIYAVDCHGHGKSSKNPKSYTAERMGTDFVWFVENVIGKPAYISGHSSGGLLTVWIAANSPKNVKGMMLEDPPLFSTEKGRSEKTYAWVDSFRLIHQFHRQNEETDYLIYYLKNSYWKEKFGKLWDAIIRQATTFRKKNPTGIFRVFYLPPSLHKIWESASNNDYDKYFGESFYDFSWFDNFEQADALAKIQCPSILIYAKNSKWEPYDENGILLGAMSEDDANLAHQILSQNKLVTIDSGHGVHDEKPKEFIEITKSILDQ